MNHTTTQAVSVDITPHSGAGEVIPSLPVERIVAQRNSGVAAFLEAIRLLRDAQKLIFEASGRGWISGMTEIIERSLSADCSTTREAALKRSICRYADRDIWTRLMNDTGMFTLMSEAQRKEWDTQLYSDDCPEITLDNVIATFRALNASKGETFEQGVIDVFRNLSWDYKTHNPCFLGKKLSLMVSWIIIAGCIFPCARMHRTASMTLPARSGSSTERPYPIIASPRGQT